MGSQDSGESDFVNGTIEKKGYRKRWVRRVKMIPGHPFNEGVHMDTHHIVSAESVNVSRLGEILVKKGYDINQIKNLVGFPATLPGACQLRTQLHRGDHTHSRPSERPYHDYVASILKKKKVKLKSCYGKTKIKEDDSEVHKLLDPISKDVLFEINAFEIPLTAIFEHFEDSSTAIGCANKFDVNPAKGAKIRCLHGRKHHQSPTNDGIDFRYQDSNARGNKKTITYTDKWEPRVGI